MVEPDDRRAVDVLADGAAADVRADAERSAAGHAGGEVRLVALEKDYAGVPAVRGIDLDIAAGEFFSLLGPSGCGKTTTLRLIAGFERPSSGQILLDGVDVAAVPANKRAVNTVFQSYALFPFKDVRDNVAFGLRYVQVSSQEARRRVDEALALVRMSAFARRRPSQLSGGQQQRVALARALVLRPRVLLLDEPLGALDAKLRKELQLELKSLQESVGVTFVYVTHDQEEALTMSDRLAVMAAGRVEQIGTPEEVYSEPSTAYVADFLGAANVLDVEVLGASGAGTACRLGDQTLTAVTAGIASGPAKLVARPERLSVSAQAGGVPEGQHVTALVDRCVYRGAGLDIVVRLAGGQTLVVSRAADAPEGRLRHGEAVHVSLPPESLRLLPPGGPTPTPDTSSGA